MNDESCCSSDLEGNSSLDCEAVRRLTITRELHEARLGIARASGRWRNGREWINRLLSTWLGLADGNLSSTTGRERSRERMIELFAWGDNAAQAAINLSFNSILSLTPGKTSLGRDNRKKSTSFSKTTLPSYRENLRRLCAACCYIAIKRLYC